MRGKMDFYIQRYKNREELKFDCEVITPMFLSGAGPNTVELRTASIKGALRFWWRALYGDDNLEVMRKKEGDLFGSTEKKSKVKISIENTNLKTGTELRGGKKYTVQSSRGTFKLPIFDYLAFGLYEYDRQERRNIYKRENIQPGSTFSLIIELNNCIEEKSQIINALSCLHYYGGIGSRARNGFGCISIKPQNTGVTLNQFTDFKLKQFTSFSEDSKILFEKSADTWEDALSEIGLAYREARLSIERRHTFVLRPYIAKPLEVKNENIHISGRHAKPYFLHVRKEIANGNPSFIGTILYLPYSYNGDKEKYKEACKKLNEYLSIKMSQGGR